MGYIGLACFLIATSADSGKFVEIAVLPDGQYIKAGDTNHNGLNEVMFVWAPLYIYEHKGNNIYDCVLIHYEDKTFTIEQVGDFDNDGCADILCKYSGGVQTLFVLEAKNSYSYPDTVIWESPPCSQNITFTGTGDLDQDGKWEFYSPAYNYLLIYENDGDNSYSLIDTLWPEPPPEGIVGEQSVGDFDGDGKLELLTSGRHAKFYVFESIGDDSVIQVFSDSLPLIGYYKGAYRNTSADMDGDGNPEFIITGHDSCGFLIQMFKSFSNNSYEPIWTYELSLDNLGADLDVTTGDVNGDGILDIIWFIDGFLSIDSVYVFMGKGNGEYECVWTHMIGDVKCCGVHDVNENGRAEIFISLDGIRVFEYQPYGIEERRTKLATKPQIILVSPNPTSEGVKISYQLPVKSKVSLKLYDISGRVAKVLVDKELKPGYYTMNWDGKNFPTGIYFARFTAGGYKEVKKLILMK